MSGTFARAPPVDIAAVGRPLAKARTWDPACGFTPVDMSRRATSCLSLRERLGIVTARPAGGTGLSRNLRIAGLGPAAQRLATAALPNTRCASGSRESDGSDDKSG